MYIKKSKLKNIHVYLVLLVVSIITICFGVFQINFKTNKNYIDFSQDWYSNNEKISLSEVYKYEKVSKILPEIKNDTQIYMNIKSINVEVYVDDQCIYKYENYNKDLFGRTPGSYFVRFDIYREYSGKEITLVFDNTYNDESGKITEIYIGDPVDVALDFVIDHILGTIISALIIFIGIILLTVYIILKIHKRTSMKILYLSIFALVIGIFMITDSKFLQFISGNEYLYHMISETCMLLIVIPLILFVSRAYRKTSDKVIINILCVLSVINFVTCYTLNLFNIMDYHESLLFTHFVYLLCIIYIIYISIKSIVEKNGNEIYHTLGLLCICIGSAMDMITLYVSSIVETSFFTRVGVLAFLCIEGVLFFIDFLKIYRQQERTALLQKLAYEDGLTELLNRTSFMEDMEKLKDCKKGLIAVYDVNNLKKVNDKYGHAEGDHLIVIATDNMKEYLNKLGKCYRIGGDEFVFISSESIEQKFILAHSKLTKSLEKYNKTSTREYDISIAMGYSVITSDTNIEEAFKIADDKMYENKTKMKSNK